MNRVAPRGGKQRSSEAQGGIVLMGVRLYNPTTGRFLSVDPVPGGSANDYDYANQDPINTFDLGGTLSLAQRHLAWLRTPAGQASARHHLAHMRYLAHMRHLRHLTNLRYQREQDRHLHASSHHHISNSPASYISYSNSASHSSSSDTSIADWGMGILGVAGAGVGVAALFVTAPAWLSVGAAVAGVASAGYGIYRLFCDAPF